jgi:hypothetical protein
MSQRVKHGNLINRILQLHDEALAVLDIYEQIMSRVDFYQKYVSLSRNHNVRLAGRFIVIDGGRSKASVQERPLEDTQCVIKIPGDA